MDAVARSRFARYSPRKVGQVLSLIRGKSVVKSYQILRYLPKKAKTIVEKTLRGAVANLNRSKNPEGVFVKEAWVNQGPALKRMRPGPMGRGLPYRHKTCHLDIIVSDGR